MKYAYEIRYQGNGCHRLLIDPTFRRKEDAVDYMRRTAKPVGIRSNPMVKRITLTDDAWARAK